MKKTDRKRKAAKKVLTEKPIPESLTHQHVLHQTHIASKHLEKQKTELTNICPTDQQR